MKKVLLLTLAVIFLGTIYNKVNAADDKAKSSDEIEAVDLGLSVKWANMNVGAKTPSGFGSYFAWGETKTKQFFSWNTYTWS